jgi:phospholipase/carboxylesterase
MLTTELVSATERTSRRLMVVLHGLGDSMEGYRWLPQMLGLPWLNYLLVDAPDAYYGGYSWYDYVGNPGPGVRRSRELLFTLLDQQRERGFPTGQTILFGFSQGCLMTIDVGLRYPQCFAGLIGVSGYVFEPEQLLQTLSPVAPQQRLLLTHGTSDSMIPIDPVRSQITLLKSAGIQIEWHEFMKEHTIAGEDELRVIRDFIRSRLENSVS